MAGWRSPPAPRWATSTWTRPSLAFGAWRARGSRREAAVWDDPDVDWLAYELVIVRSTWDYPRRRDAFVAWAERLPRVLNPAAVLRWNTDKRYLADLAAAGVPTVPTVFAAPGEPVELPEWAEFVDQTNDLGGVGGHRALAARDRRRRGADPPAGAA